MHLLFSVFLGLVLHDHLLLRGFGGLVLNDFHVGAGAMVGAERATRFDKRAAHESFGAGVLIGDDPPTLHGIDLMLSRRMRGVLFEKRCGRHQESLAKG